MREDEDSVLLYGHFAVETIRQGLGRLEYTGFSVMAILFV